VLFRIIITLIYQDPLSSLPDLIDHLVWFLPTDYWTQAVPEASREFDGLRSFEDKTPVSLAEVHGRTSTASVSSRDSVHVCTTALPKLSLAQSKRL